LNKTELVKYISDKIMVTENDAGIVFDVLFDGIKKALEHGDNVKIREFGTFFVQKRKPRKAYNPKDQSPIDVPAKKVVKFKVSKKLNERIK
jgi:nucleoid DNA-binding protein